jgi:hypothetical protein
VAGGSDDGHVFGSRHCHAQLVGGGAQPQVNVLLAGGRKEEHRGRKEELRAHGKT